MADMTNSKDLSPAEFERFRDYIHKHSGIFLEENKRMSEKGKEVAETCPDCGVPTLGKKFCPGCGKKLAAANADLFLSGHLHISHIGHTAERYNLAGHSSLVVQAGTVSSRSRGEQPSFNVLRVERPRISVERDIDAARP